MYRAARRIKCGAALCRQIWTDMGVLAGCPIAMGSLCLAIIRPMRAYLAAKPRGVEISKVYVDDFTSMYKYTMSEYTTDEAANEIAFNTRKLHKCLEKEGLYLAPDKSKILTTNKELAGRIEERLKDLGCTHEAEVKLLGVDWASGGNIT